MTRSYITRGKQSQNIHITPHLTLLRIDESLGDGCCEVVRYATTESLSSFHKQFSNAQTTIEAPRQLLDAFFSLISL